MHTDIVRQFVCILVLIGGVIWSNESEAQVCNPTLHCEWVAALQIPSEWGDLHSTPVVGQFTDDNGDQVIDSNDNPDIAFSISNNDPSRGRIVVVIDGDTCETHFTTEAANIPVWSDIAVGDIDGDNLLEIVAASGSSSFQNELAVFEHDGTHKFNVPSGPFSMGGLSRTNSTPYIADFNNDGMPDVGVGNVWFINSGPNPADWIGNVRIGSNNRGEGRFGGREARLCHAVELNGSSWMEFLCGESVWDFSVNPSLLWQNTDLEDGWTAVCDLDGDGDPEIVHSSQDVDPSITMIHVLDPANGNVIAGPFPIGEYGSSPACDDIDGDGASEILISDTAELWAIKLVGGALQELWSNNILGPRYDVQGPATFDFDGDGAAEVVYSNGTQFQIWNGAGAIVGVEQDTFPGYGNTHPVISDVNNDGTTDIVVGLAAISKLRVWSCQNACNVARTVVNQHSYHVSNVLDDGTIPTPETFDWGNPWIGQVGDTTACGCVVNPPANIGNTLLAVKRPALSTTDLRLSWSADPLADSYGVFRGIAKGIWAGSPDFNTTDTFLDRPDVAPPSSLYFYRVVGENCAGTGPLAPRP